MSTHATFKFDGSIDLNTYRTQWRAQLAQLENDLNLLKSYEGIPCASDWGMRLDRLECEAHQGANTGGCFKNVHPDEDFRTEGACADDAFENFASGFEKDPALAALVQKMTFVEPLIDPDEKCFVERWQSSFDRSGATLPEAQRHQLLELDKTLTDLRTKFSRNINDSDIEVKVATSELEGMPEDFMKSHPADENGQVTLTTRHADKLPIATYCKSDEVRRILQREYCRRCPQNIEVLEKIVEICQAKAQLLGYRNYAELDLQGRLTLQGLDSVTRFIDDVIKIAKPRADREKQALAIALETDDLKVWQANFAKEILLRRLFSGFDSSHIRPYLRAQNVLAQITLLMQELLGVRLDQRFDVKTWCESGIECYDVYDDENGQLLGRLYIDLYPRKGKNGHAFVQTVCKAFGGVHNTTEAVLVTNVPQGEDALLTYQEVSTIYHEYGHAIHAMCANRSKFGRLNNISVERDFSEAPSQFLERHLQEPEVLKRLAMNKEGQVIPDELIKNLQDSTSVADGMWTITQINFARAALIFYSKDLIDGKYPGSILEDWRHVLNKYSNFPYIEGDCFPAAFSHLGQTGYGPKYYCYMYAQAMCDELFEAFKKAPGGLLDKEMSRRYRRTILNPGSSKTAMEMVTEFLGRPPTLDAFKARLSKKLDLSAL